MLVYNRGLAEKQIIKSTATKQTRPKKKIKLSNKLFLKSIGLTLVRERNKN